MAFQHPKSYRAYAFLERGGSLCAIDVPWKDPQPGHVVVKVLACGVCASDEVVKYQLFSSVVYPRIPGHEIIGDVVAIAPGEVRWKLGDRIGAGWHVGHCSVCDRCRLGDFVTCPLSSLSPTGVGSDGGYAEYATLRSEALASISREIDPAEAAPFLCAGVTSFNALRNMQASPSDLVAIQGVGGVGHIAIQIARQMGFHTIALSSSADKRESALELGAHEFISGTAEAQMAVLRALGGARIILCTGPDIGAMTTLVNGLACDGQLLVLSFIADTLPIPVVPMLSRRLSVRGWPYGTGKDCEDAVKFATMHGIKPIIRKFAFWDTCDAYESRGTSRFRAVIVPSSANHPSRM
ncbi:uncharacterized protein FIBRA_02148 [Fibroporia radiculosa]|uniref:Enoyl reductase (ER) domain-containing protein n=1 Tax=Fibroporia radiculosa TaxID=599839 RepID=J4I8W5_9APHY|nr:uncharacterized protein FIBRA_02148 [Fibroporia radiculosa]CCM00121.1 predicted protein [Fibroporia radiculosa]